MPAAWAPPTGRDKVAGLQSQPERMKRCNVPSLIEIQLESTGRSCDRSRFSLARSTGCDCSPGAWRRAIMRSMFHMTQGQLARNPVSIPLARVKASRSARERKPDNTTCAPLTGYLPPQDGKACTARHPTTVPAFWAREINGSRDAGDRRISVSLCGPAKSHATKRANTRAFADDSA